MVIRGGGKPPSKMPSWLCHCVRWVTGTATFVGSLKWAGQEAEMLPGHTGGLGQQCHLEMQSHLVSVLRAG